MRATNRNDPLISAGNLSLLDHHISVALSELKAGSEVFLGESLRQEQQGHPIVALVLRYMAERLSSASTLEQVVAALDHIVELTKWLPQEPQDHILRKARAIAAIAAQSLDAETRDQMMNLLRKPGRPPESRGMAIRALELQRTGLKWSEIETQLLPHRRRAQNLGQSLRREVQLLKSTLRRYRVPFESA